MFKIFGSRGCGKTYQLLNYATTDPNGIIVCSNPDAMLYKIKQYNMKEIKCISYEDFLRNKHKMREKEQASFYIDEIDALLQRVDPHIAGYTMSLD